MTTWKDPNKAHPIKNAEYWCLLTNGEIHRSVWSGAFWIMGPFDKERKYSSVSMYAEIKPPPLPGESCCDEMFKKTRDRAVDRIINIHPLPLPPLVKIIKDSIKNMEKPV